MKKLFCLLALSLPLLAQNNISVQPDCFLPISIAAGATLPYNVGPFDNRTAGCTTWQIVYNSYTFSALSILVQTAPNAAGGVPGSWSTFTAVSGSNPNTATTQAVSTFGGVTSYFPWLRVQLTSGTGAGVISGRLYGWRIPPVSSATATISGTIDVDQIGNAAVLNNQQAVTGTAAALATNATRNVCVKANLANTINVYVGKSGVTTGTGFELDPGASVCLPVANSNLLYVIASTTGATVSWVGTE